MLDHSSGERQQRRARQAVVSPTPPFDPSSVATLTLRNSSVNDNQQTLQPDQDERRSGGGGIANVDGHR